MNLAPWKARAATPFFRSSTDDVTSFQREMNSLVNTFFGRNDWMPLSGIGADFYPAVDLKEIDNKYYLDADVPGLNESDIDLDLHDNILTIKGEKKSEKEMKNDEYVCVERSRGAFRRDIYLDSEVDQSSIKAMLKNGVLHVELLKKEPIRTTHKKIQISH